MSLGADLHKFALKGNRLMKQVMFNSLQQVGNSVIMNSPIRFGIFRGNWNSSIGDYSTETTSVSDITGSRVQGELVAKLSSLDLGQSFYFTNSLPYGEVIEYGGYSKGPLTTNEGYSKKAPAGMVGISVNLFPSIVEREVKRLR